VVFADVGSVYMRYGMLGEPISNNENQRDGRVVPSLVMKVKGCLLVVLFALPPPYLSALQTLLVSS
jgi:hypothetical protein